MRRSGIKTERRAKERNKKRLPVIEQTSRPKLISTCRSRSKSKTHQNALQPRGRNVNDTFSMSLPWSIKDRFSNNILSPKESRCRSFLGGELQQQFDTRIKAPDLRLPFLAEYNDSRFTLHPKISQSTAIVTPKNDPVLLEARELLERARSVQKKERTLHEQQDLNSSCQDQGDEQAARSSSEDVVDISNNRPTEAPIIIVDEVESVDADETDYVDITKYVDFLDKPDFDYDGEFVPTESYDLTHFDFDGLTKPKRAKLTINQQQYQNDCRYYGILPSAFILRQLATSELRLCGQQLGRQRIKALCSALAFNCTVYDLEISEDVIGLAMEA